MQKSCILIHGAWHGSWIWKDVAELITNLGYQTALTPDLPGHADDFTGGFRDITLNEYVSYITNLAQNLSDPVVLVGHSMAGIIISQVAENIPSKIAYLIYVSGFIPNYSGSLIDEEKYFKFSKIASLVSINEKQYLISLNPKIIKELFYNCCNDIDFKYAKARFQNQPLLPFLDKVSLSNEHFGSVPKFYIECLQDRAIDSSDQRRMYSKINCSTYSLNSDHSPFFSAKKNLVELISIIDSQYESNLFKI